MNRYKQFIEETGQVLRFASWNHHKKKSSKTSPNDDFSKEKEHMRDEIPTSSPPKLSPTEITSPNTNIKSNKSQNLNIIQ